MKNEYEGFYKSVKKTLLAVRKNKVLGKGVEGAVAELITVDKKYEKAVEVALGSSLQNIVTETETDAKNIINYLKKNKLGRVTFLPMTSIKGRYLNSRERQLLHIRGSLGVASELIQYNQKYKDIFNYLLGRVVIVDNIDNGIKVAKESNYTVKVVSLDGDVINAGGSMTGGSYKSNYTNILGRERQISELQKEINKLNKEKYSLENKVASCKTDLANVMDNLSKLDEEINNLRINFTKLENKELQQEEEIGNLKSMVEKYKQELVQLQQEQLDSENRTKELKKELEELKLKSDSTQGNIGDMMKNFDEEKSRRDTLQKEITDIKVKIASYEQEVKSVNEALSKLKEEKERMRNNLEHKKKEYEVTINNIKDLKIKCEELKEKKEQLKGTLNENDSKLQELKQQKNQYLDTFYSEQEKLNEMNREINELQKSINNLEVKHAKYNTQLENMINKLWDEYELSYQMALKYKNEDISISKIQNQIKELKSKIRTLGTVNVGAIEEYKRLKERYEFLTEQKKDLTSAEESLKKVIKDMENKMEEQFIEKFHEIRENFNRVFKQLFGGGKSDIYLEDESDALKSGIEIIAQPPGKKLQRISLLSGGEKALTAIALLFAILNTKPTPFCILDEIEAALDDANVYRFADYLREFSQETQFIVITHRKGTMESADALYGVTMEEEGVTKLVSVKLSEKLSEKAS
ncbi:Chromosome partition protein smc [Caldisalinibacter kiritimatiensis]|uniref:Chromosome partition protein smc n=2 Tax=Caldisalinibacter kiritimatiensis TaxID=1304284 RepID=R1CR48_9FIRM|nr:Chromosome partition protein smc [Caldisalinibacter kiritimatiensis]